MPREDFELSLGLVPGHQALVEIPREPFQVAALVAVQRMSASISRLMSSTVPKTFHSLVCYRSFMTNWSHAKTQIERL